uniref:leukotriene B4 receptor 1-like n=1 Tax=Monopterus albus TaxID=43700 RepID=UPI0009B38D1A|nr:leukotriene B4 receptor 1-like [Monopterus albus]
MALGGSVPSLDNSTSFKNETIVDNPTATAMGALIMTLAFLLGLPGNAFVIWSILTRARKQTVTTLLILNLAIADGFLMALTPFFIIYLVLKKWVFGREMCKILFYLCLVNMYASLQLIMVMSIYRLVAVLFPQRISAITRQRTVMRLLVVVWVLVMVASVPAIIFRDVRNNVCSSFHDKNSHVVLQYTPELVLGFLLPYGVILVSYICILRRIRQTKFRRRIRSEKLILAIVLTFCFFWLPYHIVNIVQISWASSPEGPVKGILGKIWQRSRAVTSSIAFISSCANPVLYFFAAKSYIRREGLAFMARLFEHTGLDSATRKSRQNSRQNSQNSREKDKDAEVVMLKDKEQDSETNSSSNIKEVKNVK